MVEKNVPKIFSKNAEIIEFPQSEAFHRIIHHEQLSLCS